VFAVTSRANANNFGGPLDAGKHCDTSSASQCVANSSVHTTCIVSASGTHTTAFELAIDHYNTVAPLLVYEEPPPCGDLWDVHLWDSNQGLNGIIAYTRCATGAQYGGSESNGTRWCAPQVIVWNTAYNNLLTTGNKRQYVACHELGHTLGLRHWLPGEPNATCMRPATVDPVFIPATFVTSADDRADIDAYYP